MKRMTWMKGALAALLALPTLLALGGCWYEGHRDHDDRDDHHEEREEHHDSDHHEGNSEHR